jgi:hypothetical protein
MQILLFLSLGLVPAVLLFIFLVPDRMQTFLFLSLGWISAVPLVYISDSR